MQATQEVVSRMPIITNDEFDEAVQAAKDAFPAWKRTPVPHRQRVMLKFQQLIRENMVRLHAAYCCSDVSNLVHAPNDNDVQDALAANITQEQGKTLADAKGDVFRGLGMSQIPQEQTLYATASCATCCHLLSRTAEVVEYSCNLAPDLMGEYVEGVSPGMDTYSIKQPLGVCISIHPAH